MKHHREGNWKENSRGQLLFDKEAKQISWERIVFTTNGAWTPNIHMQKTIKQINKNQKEKNMNQNFKINSNGSQTQM